MKVEKSVEKGNPHTLEFIRCGAGSDFFEHQVIVSFDVGIYNPNDFYCIVF